MMLQDARKRIFIAISIAAGLGLAAFLLFLAFRGAPTAPAATEPVAPAAAPSESSVPLPAAAAPTAPQSSEDIFLRQRARDFVERYGSYSNQNDNAQIADAMAMASARMQSYLASKKQDFAAEYAGANTTVVATSLTSKTDVAAEVRVDVQRVVFSDGSEQTEYQSGRVTFIRDASSLPAQAGEWKVDGLYWQ